jgi:hypothetical protein
VTLSSLLQYAKHHAYKISTDDGLQIDFSDAHSQNTNFPIRESFDPVQNVKLLSREQPHKQDSQRISTENGIEIDFNGLHMENGDSSSRIMHDRDSKVTLANNSADGRS